MRKAASIKAYFISIFLSTSLLAYSQSSMVNTVSDTSLSNAVKLYHQYVYPETGLYNGSEYTYNLYYPFIINEGHPFFVTKQFDTGAVFYNNVLYENVPLLYDLVKDEVLIKDPANVSIIRINKERIGWFNILGHTFIKINKDSTNASIISPGFYDLLYNGSSCSLYNKVSKIFKENSASFQGINKYIVEENEYFIRKDNQYFKVKNKKSLLSVMDNNKKEIEQFIRKSKFKLKGDMDYALTKIVTYYDELNAGNTKTK